MNRIIAFDLLAEKKSKFTELSVPVFSTCQAYVLPYLIIYFANKFYRLTCMDIIYEESFSIFA